MTYLSSTHTKRSGEELFRAFAECLGLEFGLLA